MAKKTTWQVWVESEQGKALLDLNTVLTHDDPQSEFQTRMRIAFCEGMVKEQRTQERESKKIALEVVKVYNEVMLRKVDAIPSRIKMIQGIIRQGKDLNPPIGLEQFRAVFEYKKREWDKDREDLKRAWFDIESICRPGNFFRNLDAARDAYRERSKGVFARGTLFKQD